MSKYYAKKHTFEKTKEISKQNTNFFSKNLKKIYPIGLQKRSCSPILSLSSLSLSLSQNSIDSSITDFSPSPPLDQKIVVALSVIAPIERRDPAAAEAVPPPCPNDEGEPRRCNWITKNSGNN